MWTRENRAKYDREGLRYPTDQTDSECALAKPFVAIGKYLLEPDDCYVDGRETAWRRRTNGALLPGSSRSVFNHGLAYVGSHHTNSFASSGQKSPRDLDSIRPPNAATNHPPNPSP